MKKINTKRDKNFHGGLSDRDQFLSDVMAQANTDYWADVSHVRRSKSGAIVSYRVRYNDRDDTDPKCAGVRLVSRATLAAAIDKILRGDVEIGADIAVQFLGFPGGLGRCDVDSVGADCAVQVAAYGEILFG